jgi:hypothetical protein
MIAKARTAAKGRNKTAQDDALCSALGSAFVVSSPLRGEIDSTAPLQGATRIFDR